MSTHRHNDCPSASTRRLTPRVAVAAGQAGVWRMTYVDEELRVLFASGLTNTGKPARVENIYILKKN